MRNIFTCAQCGKSINGIWNPGTRRQEPASLYWLGQDISEAYCSPECSLKRKEFPETEAIPGVGIGLLKP